MAEPGELDYLTADDVVKINKRTIELHGGTFGIRDQGLLESAVAQPEQHVFGEDLHPTIQDKAAAYLYYLSQNHPFHDGNKRTALMAASTFLRLNDHQLTLTNEEAERITLEVAAGERSKEELTKTLAQHIEPGRERAEQERQQRENVFGDHAPNKSDISEERPREMTANVFGDAPDVYREAELPERDFERSR